MIAPKQVLKAQVTKRSSSWSPLMLYCILSPSLHLRSHGGAPYNHLAEEERLGPDSHLVLPNMLALPQSGQLHLIFPF